MGGYNFGTGSSREQAATSLKYCGIQLVLAGSFSQTYKRNAINNGFLVLEAPNLLADLKNKFSDSALSIKTGLTALIDFQRAQINVNDKKYPINPIGKAAQELVLTLGLENWVKGRI